MGSKKLAMVAGGPVSTVAGTWSMDLSPGQNGSYLKELVIVPDVDRGPGASVHTFTGTVYGGSPFDNGQCVCTDAGIVLAFVSDEKGEMGGPYYWLGWLDLKATRPASSMLTGRVRSLSRNFEMQWSATRTATMDQSQPAAKSATKSR